MINNIKKKDILAIIPARGGSKRIKNKNIKLFLGKPIISYVIKLAIKSKIFDKIIVSTDSKKISNISLKNGAEILFQRPKKLSGDFVSTKNVIQHSINWLNKNSQKPLNVCCIYPTAVLLSLEDLKKAYQKFKLGDFEFLFSATKYSHPIERSFQIQKGKIKMSHIKNFNKRTQDFSPSYYDVGQFYWGKVNSWLNNEIIFNKNSAIHLIPKDKVQDIDTLDDWKFAEKLYSIKK